MLPTPMKPMAPAQGMARPAKPRMAQSPGKALGQKRAMRAKANVAQRPTMGAPAGGAAGQSVLGGARLLPQRQVGSVRANAARGIAEQQARQAQMQAAQVDNPDVVPEVERQAMANQPPPMMADRMARPGMEQDPQMQMKQQLMRRAQMQQMMQQMQAGGRGIPQNMGDIQSLVPQDLMQQRQMAEQRMQDPYAGRFMGQGGPYPGAGMMGNARNLGFGGFNPQEG